jgi:conjugal transfer pilus assembly protein TraB
MFFGKKPDSDTKGKAADAVNDNNSRIKALWTQMPAGKQRRIIVFGTICAIILLSLAGYRAKYGKQNETQTDLSQVHEIDINGDMIEKNLYTRTLDIVENQTKRLEDLSAQIKKIKQTQSITSVPEPKTTSPLVSITESHPDKTRLQEKKPPVRSSYRVPPPVPPVPEEERIQVIGGISIIRNEHKPAELPVKGKKKQKIYLPPSFMEATLLSGVAAPTTLAAKKDPLPVLLRIKNLAVLPNKVKADLKGCFAIAEATGNLADERVHLRLLTLSCVAKNGDAVIDQQVKGFVVDSDGKVGLAGNVVAKMGIHVARSALAGFIAGFGEAVESTTSDVSLNPLTGTTTKMWSTEDTESVIKKGAGKGISQAADQLQNFYLQLAEQTLPVIEVGATKSVTLVISEGANLEIKEQNTKI